MRRCGGGWRAAREPTAGNLEPARGKGGRREGADEGAEQEERMIMMQFVCFSDNLIPSQSSAFEWG